MNRARGFVFTFNNYTAEEAVDVLEYGEHNCTYMVFGFETAPKTGTPHLQGFMYYANPRSFNAVVDKFFKGKVHVEIAKDVPAAITYCKKGGLFQEHGDPPKQGERTDFKEVCDKIKSGQMTVEEVLWDYPQIYHQYGRTLTALTNMKRDREAVKETRCKGIWYYGLTNTGKSYRATHGIPKKDIYLEPDDGDWWDGYTGQPRIVVDEFRGRITFSKLLQLTGEVECFARRRNLKPTLITSTELIITSPLHPQECYKNLHKDDKWEQFWRRFTVIECLSHDTEVVRGNTNPDQL